MTLDVKLGRRPKVDDPRVPFLADLGAARTLPPPPAEANWYAAIGEWGMLGNDRVGDCVEAAIGHATLQFTSYAGSRRRPTAEEAVALYAETSGYVPGEPDTDQGSVVLGPGGVVPYWAATGVTFGGVRSFAKGVLKIHPGKLTSLQQGVHYFGGLLLGINLPASILDREEVPYMWSDPSGPSAGGHEVWVDGYLTEAGAVYWDFVSWGQRCRMTHAFLEAVAEEAVSVYDPDSLNGRGVDAADFSPTELLAAMDAIRTT